MPRRAQAIVASFVASFALSMLARGAYAEPPSESSVPAAEIPPPTDVNDPMLAKPPDAPRTIQSWEDALRVVREKSPDYIASYETIARAQAQSRIALAAVLPSVGVSGGYTHQFITDTLNFGGLTVMIPPANSWSAGGALAWSIVNPRALYAVGTARRAIAVAELSFAERRRVIALTLVSEMLTTLATARTAELTRVGLRAALERLALTQGKLRFGQGTALDVDRAEQDVQSARAQLIRGDELLRRAREALGITLGSKVPVAVNGDLDLDSFERAVVTTCRLNDDVEKRADIQAARARVTIAERAITDAWLQFAPTVSVLSQFQTSSEVSFGAQTTWAVQGVVTLPIYDGGVRYGMLRDARAAAEQARQALVLTRLNALVNVAQSQRSVSVFKASRDVAQEQRDLAARIDQRTREGYVHGLGTSLDLVVSAVALRQADISLVILDFQFAEARADAVLSNASCAY